MDPMKAIDLVDGFSEPKDRNELIEAWQYLIDTQLAWTLPGRYGRTAHALIQNKECTP